MRFDIAKLAWALLGVALVVVLAVVFEEFFGTLLFALFVYYAARPVYRRINDHTEHPDLAATVTLLVFALPAFVVVLYTLWTALHGLDQLLQTLRLQQFHSVLEPYIDVSVLTSNQSHILATIFKNPLKLFDTSPLKLLRRLPGSIVVDIETVFRVLLDVFVMVAVVFYLLRDDQKIAAWFRDSVEEDGELVEEFLTGVDDDLFTVYAGNILHAVVIGVLSVIVYNGLNLIAPSSLMIPYPSLLGILTGIGSLVPIVGMKIVYVPVAVALLFIAVTSQASALWFPIVFFAVTFVFVDTIPDFFVRAYIAGRGLHTGLLMFSYIFGTVVFGWMGLFLGPLVLVLVLHFARLVFPWLLRRESAA
ncbi:MAG TPA: AI-2E family transporter [Halococcus sp.]|nr:AI-2E family transporter [Halococcus sp.]